ncbi:MAG: hypothetical protein AAF399_21545 [Bacteroidota bacterium]
MSVIKSVATFSIVFLLSLLGIEGYLQLSEIDLSYHELNPDLGKKIQPDKRIIMLKEGFYLGRSNELGYLGPAYPRQKADPNTFRIALMGDSYAEGFQLMDRFHFRTLLENQLTARTGKNVEVLNFGSGNFNFHDMHLAYRNFASEFEPDYVLYLVRPKSFEERNSHFIPSPYFYLENDSLSINYDFREKGVFQTYNRFDFLFENSAFLKMAQNCYKLASKGRAPQIIFDKFYKMFHYSEAKDIDLEDIDEEVDLTPVTLKVLEEIEASDKSMLMFRKKYPDNIAQYLDEHELPFVQLGDTLEVLRAAGNHPRYWKATKKKGHWNHDGHQAVATYLTKILTPVVLGETEEEEQEVMEEELPEMESEGTE